MSKVNKGKVLKYGLACLCGSLLSGSAFGLTAKEVSKNIKELNNAFKTFEKFQIVPGDLYTRQDVLQAWSEPLKELTENVVRINTLEIQKDGLEEPTIGTGTLVDVGEESLRGRVVITCAHCGVGDAYKGKTLSADKRGLFSVEKGGVLSSITVSPETEYAPTSLPLFNSFRRDVYPAITNRLAFPAQVIYNHPEADFCVIILKNPVTVGGEVVNGIPLNKLVPAPENKQILQGNVHFNLGFGENPIVIGYGVTGVYSRLSDNLFGGAGSAVRWGGLRERQELLQSIGWNRKKAVRLRGLDSLGLTTTQGCEMCGDDFASNTMAGQGFSGSLVVAEAGDSQKNEEKGEGEKAGESSKNEKKRKGEKLFHVYGIYSGPVFTQELKSFIVNRAKNYLLSHSNRGGN